LINVSTTSSYRTEAVATRRPIYSSLGTQSFAKTTGAQIPVDGGNDRVI
jgi:hypothetical protein